MCIRDRNKADLLDQEAHEAAHGRIQQDKVLVWALTGEGMTALKAMRARHLTAPLQIETIRLHPCLLYTSRCV